jgi:putative transposase
VVLQDRFRVCQRRACRLAGQNHTTQRRPVPVVDIEEQKLRRRIRELARRHVRWGRRLVYRRLRIEYKHHSICRTDSHPRRVSS